MTTLYNILGALFAVCAVAAIVALFLLPLFPKKWLDEANGKGTDGK